jgi:hypothetical protein
MSKPTIDGKKHISEKPKGQSTQSAFTPMNTLDIPPEAKREIEEAGMEARWVDSKQFADHGNVHKNHWQLYKKASATVSQGVNPLTGLPPDGTIRRGTLVLAVRSKEISDGHRAELKRKAARMSGSVKNQGEELRQIARKGGISERIFDETEIED